MFYILISSALGLGLICYPCHIFMLMLKRTRWLMISMIVIFSFSTPGEYLQLWPFDLAPTHEGLTAALWHVISFCIMLAGLSLLLVSTSRESLIAGFYQILSPLNTFNVHIDRVAARLCLTLYYVEQTPRMSLGRNMFECIQMNMNCMTQAPEHILLYLPALNTYDKFAMLGLVLIGLYCL